MQKNIHTLSSKVRSVIGNDSTLRVLLRLQDNELWMSSIYTHIIRRTTLFYRVTYLHNLDLFVGVRTIYVIMYLSGSTCSSDVAFPEKYSQGHFPEQLQKIYLTRNVTFLVLNSLNHKKISCLNVISKL